MRQALIWCTVLSGIAFALAAVRVRLLPAAREYGLFFWLLISWCAISAFTVGMPLSSRYYFLTFMVVVPLSWVLYFCTARHLYQTVFKKYPGIAFAGRSSMWIAVALMAIGVASSIALSPGRLVKRILFATVLLVDRCVLFGIAFFLVLLVSVMIRYPISIPKNIAFHSIFLSSILFLQTLCQVGDQWTFNHYTLYWDTVAAGFDAVLVVAWAISLTNAGDTAIIRIRQNIRPETERHLLGQLDALNGILLRAARK